MLPILSRRTELRTFASSLMPSGAILAHHFPKRPHPLLVDRISQYAIDFQGRRHNQPVSELQKFTRIFQPGSTAHEERGLRAGFPYPA